MHLFQKRNFLKLCRHCTKIIDWLMVLCRIGNISALWFENFRHGLNFHHVYMKNNMNIMDYKATL